MNSPTPDLDRRWQRWLTTNPEKRTIVDQARKIILSLNYPEYTPDPSLKQHIFHQVEEHAGEKGRVTLFHKKVWLRVAAVLVFIISTAALVYLYTGSRQQENNSFMASADTELVQHQNAPGERTQHILPDGTKVDLNAGSRLEYPQEFTKEARTVRLDGEAYFEVAHNQDWPFKVITEDFAVTVLGTQFNVNTNTVTPSVALVDGKVRLNANTSGESVELTPNQIAFFDEQERSFTSTSFDPDYVTGWKDGYLVFREASLDDVVKKLQAWYGVQVSVRNKSASSDWSYTASFKQESLENVLLNMRLLRRFDYQIKNDSLILSF